jgi:phosphate-selective porin OprO and OprP
MKSSSLTFRGALVALVLLLTAAPLSLRAQTGSDDLSELREQIRLLDQKLRVLERKEEIEDETAAAAPKPPVIVASPGGFSFTSADKAFDLKLRALAQFDARFFLDDGAANRDAFLLRRTRTIFTGTVANLYDFTITPELGGGTNNSTTVGLWDAFIAARFSPKLGLRFGKFPSAVGLEPGSNRHFIESPFVNALQPNRDLGAEIFGALGGGFLEYRLGVFNGAANNTTNFGGASADYADGDKTLAGRVTVVPLKNVDGIFSTVSLGLGASRGNEIGTAGANLANGLANITSHAQQAIFSYGGALFANGTHTRLSPSLEWYIGNPFSFVAEYAWEKQEIAVNAAGLTRSFKNAAWRANAGWVLTGEPATKVGVTPAQPFDLTKRTWGAFEIVARASALDLDDTLFDSVANGGAGLNRLSNVSGARAYGLGVNWYLNRNVRFLLNAEHTVFDDAKTPTAAVGAQDDELAIISRVHLSF